MADVRTAALKAVRYLSATQKTVERICDSRSVQKQLKCGSRGQRAGVRVWAHDVSPVGEQSDAYIERAPAMCRASRRKCAAPCVFMFLRASAALSVQMRLAAADVNVGN
jgi:hypothetical protein